MTASLILNLVILIIASVILVKAATMLVQAVTTISTHFKISEFTVSFILMAFITSLPEVAISINSALSNNPNLALGTALGSNLVDLTLIIAIPVLVSRGIKVQSVIARKDSLFMALFAVIPIIMLLDGSLSRPDGVILIIFYGLYLYRLLGQRIHFDEPTDLAKKNHFLHQTLIFAGGVILLFGASRLLVYSATNIAEFLEIPIVLVGLILVSAGTSLPELAFELKAVTSHHDEQVLGNILGSVVANSTLVLAIAALINPITIQDFTAVTTTIIYLLIVLVLFIVGIHTDKELRMREALVLLVIYFIYLLTEFGFEIVHKVNPIP